MTSNKVRNTDDAGVPWLSVVMPTYNGARHLRSALESVAAEGVEGLEIIVVDDGSTDDTTDILEAAAATMPLRLVAGAGHAGWVTATNIGMRHVRGAWVCMLHQDDVWMPGRLGSLAEAIARDPHAGLIVGQSEFIDDRGRSIGRWRLPWHGATPGRAETARRLYVQNWLAVPSACMRADLLSEVGQLDEDLWYTADWDLWLRLVREAPIVSAAGVLSGFRVHASSQTVERSRDVNAFVRQMSAVQSRHRWAAGGRRDVIAAGEMSTLVNAGLASLLHGNRFPLGAVARQASRLRARGWLRFARDSRLLDRGIPRMRLAVRARGRDPDSVS
jgi:glycosyltransferase involved in cell wall biosynthesis